jgi:hypothetical protein
MTRLRRVVAVNVPHHLTQRGNARQYILNRDEDRAVYLKLAAIRRCTHTGRPLGGAAFLSELEQTTGRRLRTQSKGRRKESTQNPRQASLSLDAPPV